MKQIESKNIVIITECENFLLFLFVGVFVELDGGIWSFFDGLIWCFGKINRKSAPQKLIHQQYLNKSR